MLLLLPDTTSCLRCLFPPLRFSLRRYLRLRRYATLPLRDDSAMPLSPRRHADAFDAAFAATLHCLRLCHDAAFYQAMIFSPPPPFFVDKAARENTREYREQRAGFR